MVSPTLAANADVTCEPIPVPAPRRNFQRACKQSVKSLLISLHRQLAALGVHVLPNHFYSAFADLRTLEKTRSEWAQASQMVGVDMSLSRQIGNVRQLCDVIDEPEGLAAYRKALAEKVGLGYGLIEAKFLYAQLRKLQPRRVIEVGGGISTAVIRAALKKNKKFFTHTVIEPYPSKALYHLTDGRLLPKRAQQCLDTFEQLEAGDFLFIDSSHTVKPGSDVVFLILEVLPRLAKGVTIHFHDVFFPYDYQLDVLKTLYQWQETALLHAYLVSNEKCEVLYALSDLFHRAPEELHALCPEFQPVATENGLLAGSAAKLRGDEEHFPCSVYLRTR